MFEFKSLRQVNALMESEGYLTKSERRLVDLGGVMNGLRAFQSARRHDDTVKVAVLKGIAGYVLFTQIVTLPQQLRASKALITGALDEQPAPPVCAGCELSALGHLADGSLGIAHVDGCPNATVASQLDRLDAIEEQIAKDITASVDLVPEEPQFLGFAKGLVIAGLCYEVFPRNERMWNRRGFCSRELGHDGDCNPVYSATLDKAYQDWMSEQLTAFDTRQAARAAERGEGPVEF